MNVQLVVFNQGSKAEQPACLDRDAPEHIKATSAGHINYSKGPVGTDTPSALDGDKIVPCM